MSDLRTLIRVDIRIDQHWSIRAAPDLHFRPDPSDTEDSDRTIRLPVQRDPLGRYHLPATSLVGGLAQHMRTAASLVSSGSTDVAATSWLGSANDKQTTPSQLRCLAATIHPVDADEISVDAVEVRSTQIDPARRAAKEHTLRTQELLPPALVTWWLEWDHHDVGQRLDDLLKLLKAWLPVIGGRRSANRGRGVVQAVQHRTLDLTKPDDLTWWLGERPAYDWHSKAMLSDPWKCWQNNAATNEGQRLLSCSFRVVDSLHLGGEGRRTDENSREITRTKDTLPSTSWRGVFRHRVAHILRVSGREDEIVDTQARLFGSGRERGASADAGTRGQLRFGDSPVTATRHTRTHVAIDRISGGAAQVHADDPLEDAGLLFTVDYFGHGATLDLVIYNDSEQEVIEPDRALLAAVIQDLDDGIIGVGGMTSRGYGTLERTTEIMWEGASS